MSLPIFDPQRGIWPWLGRLADVLSLSLLWAFCSLPVFTLGAATAALYDAAARCVRGGQQGPLARFWSTFRRELKTGAVVTVVWGGVCVLLIRGVWTLRANIAFQGTAAALVLAAWYGVLLLPVGALCWMFPLLSRFTFTPGRLIATGLRFAVGYFPYTAAISISAVAAVILSGWLLVPLLVLPCLTALFWTLPMERVFRKYTPEE